MEIQQSEKLIEAINNYNKVNVAIYIMQHSIGFEHCDVDKSRETLIEILNKK